MKHLLLNKAFTLIVGLMFTHAACAQTTGGFQEAESEVYDEDDTAALANYLKTSYCPHEISVWASGSISTLNCHPVFGKTNTGAGGAFGAGYTYFLSKNWGLSSGLEYAFYQRTISLNGFVDAYETLDILNNPIIYNTRINNYSEKQVAGLLNIPLLVQYQTGGNHLFYAAAGLKLGLPVVGKYSGSNAILTASGYYPDYDQTEMWQNDLDSGVFNRNENKVKLNLGVSVMGTLETGVKWNIGIGTNLYTGVFVDYDFNNALNGDYSKKHLIEYNRNEPAHPIMNTVCVLTDRFSPLSFGMKLKWTFSVG
ncbi:MAG: outer membrane beta-barrel protein, partial [Candidatus Symbiothrix sp.]|nr:outer membrane beta-barrel protein [Candidatus Symbiothrix sp.]